ncbi:HPF/RaiA family ribosome-associated protein [Sedimenticola hydrogenitrophicus]|uniref:HPF/RaiA family ribosome-associated protein n=1 Tax=Sedimenticola hydrogenitrophicus TaxID=2967975 RepID=UPI0021A635EB|nr:HPF/RaiA family ribosome-associated protein [Sedimenticola hydrogenitrophicus]
MKIPLQLTFRNMDHSDAVEADVRNHAAKLEQLFPNIITSCRVMVERRHRHHQQGNLFHARVDITVRGRELVASRKPDQHHAHEEMHVAIRDAFAATKRQLRQFTHKLRHEVKSHQSPPHGRVVSLMPMEDFGRIRTDDGREIYFHRNSVINGGFDRLEIGDQVRFNEGQGDVGPQATTVKVAGKHHILPDRP